MVRFAIFSDSSASATIFNVGGNNYRLITAIDYNTETCFIVVPLQPIPEEYQVYGVPVKIRFE